MATPSFRVTTIRPKAQPGSRFRQPFVLDEASGLRKAGAILATFGVSDAAIMNILTGVVKPSGKLPYALAGNAKAIVEQEPDAPGYDEKGTLFPFGHGLVVDFKSSYGVR